MNRGTIKYVKLNDVNSYDFVSLLNSRKTREHLIQHEYFNTDTVEAWIRSKIEIDSFRGCKVRAIICENHLAGWCGIQFEDGKYEVAIVIDEKYWGLGKKVFSKMMRWAKELGHDHVYIHLLHTRPEYKFLQKISRNVYQTELLGNRFTTYQLEVK